MALTSFEKWCASLRGHLREWLRYARHDLQAWFRTMRTSAPPYGNTYMPPMTLRFQFGKKGYVPEARTKGTWRHIAGDTWDWTCTDTNWATAFGGGATGIPGAFSDMDNPVKLVAAGDTKTVTDFSRFFQNCPALVEICPIDTSGATTVFLMFSHCDNVAKFYDLDFSNATDVRAVFQYCDKMVTAPNIVFPKTSFRLDNFFYMCHALEHVPCYDLSLCTNITSMFYEDSALKDVPYFNTSTVGYMKNTFRGTAITRIPDLDYTNVLDLSSAFNSCLSLNNLSLIDAPKVQGVDSLFNRCTNVESGMLEFYEYLNSLSTITTHKSTFTDCGVNTESGMAELQQIPTDWGGLAV